jgi:hypothetical protein
METDAAQDCVLAGPGEEDSLAAVGHQTLEMPAAVCEFSRERALKPYKVEVCSPRTLQGGGVYAVIVQGRGMYWPSVEGGWCLVGYGLGTCAVLVGPIYTFCFTGSNTSFGMQIPLLYLVVSEDILLADQGSSPSRRVVKTKGSFTLYWDSVLAFLFSSG